MKSASVFDFITVEFRKAKIPFVLIGGFAVNYYRVTRATADIDILMTDLDFQTALPLLEKRGYQLVTQTDLFVRFVHRECEWMDLDIMFIDRDTINGIVKEGKEVEMLGTKVTVPSLEHLIALKLHSIKHNPEHREFRDLGDIVELIRRNQLDVRSDGFRDLCLKYGTDELYRKILESQKK
jgi:predicted nucleotidyltransferase